MAFICIGFLVLTANFTESKVNVNESDRTVDICVKKSLQTIPDVEFTINSHGGNATGNGMQYAIQASLNYVYMSLLPLFFSWSRLQLAGLYNYHTSKRS